MSDENSWNNEPVIQERKNKGHRKLLVLSLVINLALATLTGFVIIQNNKLINESSDYATQLNQLAQSNMMLEQKLNMTTSQLNYYKQLSGYYSTTGGQANNSSSGFIGTAEIPILAVQTIQTFFQTDYQGFVLHAKVELVEGQGRVLVDTQVINGADLQASVRTAASAVEKLLGVSFSNTDIILTITSDQSVDMVDGPSAGGALTVAILAALEGKTPKEGVYMTGTINNDGSIGEVGGIPYKALAAAEQGANTLLVPTGQATVVSYEPKIITIGRNSITTYQKVSINLKDYLAQNGYNVDVVEVSNVLDAYNAFTN
jgi:uncharacterized protein